MKKLLCILLVSSVLLSNVKTASAKIFVQSYNGVTYVEYLSGSRNDKKTVSYKADLDGNGSKEVIKVTSDDILRADKTATIKINGKTMAKQKVAGTGLIGPVGIELYKISKKTRLLGICDYEASDWCFDLCVYKYDGKKLIKLSHAKTNRGVVKVRTNNQIIFQHITYPEKLLKKGKMKVAEYTYTLQGNKLKLVKTKKKITEAAG